MSVMNIKHLFFAAATLTVFAACSDYDPGMSENVLDYTDEQLETLNEYAKNFVEYYGDIDPNHTWGFGEMGSEDEVMTTRYNQPNNNQWVQFTFDDVNDPSTVNGYDYNTVNQLEVPGFPSYVDGKFYTEQTPNGGTWDDIKAYFAESRQKEVNPTIGDVTDEEILYVSAWFRTHPDITPEKCITDNFFTQVISKDYDRVSYGDLTGLDANGNGTSNWAETTCGLWDNRVPIIHYDENGNVLDKDPNNNQPWGESDSYTTKEFSLDQLTALEKGGSVENGCHIYNNNAGNTSLISNENPTVINPTTWTATGTGEGITGKSYRAVMYFTGATTEDFKAYSSSAREHWEYKWVLRHLTFTGRDDKHYDGWYLAFDMAYYEVQESYANGQPKKVAKKDYDGYYSNYIIKIKPGKGYISDESDHQWYRVMCEDLGSTFDYDFNDLVFDVYFTGESPNYTANIKVKAAGGVYPIYIGEENPANEAHCLLGRSDTYDGKMYKPINVGGETGIHTDILQLSVNSTNPDLIPIIVDPTGTSNPRNTFILPERLGGYKTSNEWTNPEVPQKICIPGNTTKWTKEYQWIDKAYPLFPEWVHEQDGTYGFPYKTVDGKKKYFEADGTGWKLVTDPDKNPWNTVGIDESYLYQ